MNNQQRIEKMQKLMAKDRPFDIRRMRHIQNLTVSYLRDIECFSSVPTTLREHRKLSKKRFDNFNRRAALKIDGDN